MARILVIMADIIQFFSFQHESSLDYKSESNHHVFFQGKTVFRVHVASRVFEETLGCRVRKDGKAYWVKPGNLDPKEASVRREIKARKDYRWVKEFSSV